MSASLVMGTAWAQSPALDEEKQPETVNTDPAVAAAPAETPVEYGVGLRIRNVRVPKALLELFVDRAAGGASHLGLGVELTRRRGTVEIQLGLEYEKLNVGEGVWINRDEDVAAGNEADFIVSPEHAPGGTSLGWFTIEFTFLNHAPINKYVAVRYGGGAGIGILTGKLYRYDVLCAPGSTNNNPEPGCRPTERGGTSATFTGPVEYDLPPVMPVVNFFLGVQITPLGNKKLVVNLEGGIRLAPFFGTSVGYFF